MIFNDSRLSYRTKASALKWRRNKPASPNQNECMISAERAQRKWFNEKFEHVRDDGELIDTFTQLSKKDSNLGTLPSAVRT